MSEVDIAAVRIGDTSLSAWDQTLVRAADELVQTQKLGDASWAALGTRFTTEQAMEVVFLVGCYTVMAMLTNSFGIALEGDPEADAKLKAMRQYT